MLPVLILQKAPPLGELPRQRVMGYLCAVKDPLSPLRDSAPKGEPQ